MAALRWIRPLQVTAPQKAVLWALADQADDDGEAWPSMAALVEATCLSERTVQGAIAALRATGIISITPGGGRHRTTLYRLSMAETPQAVRGKRPTETPQETRETPQHMRDTPQQVRETPQELHPNPQEPPRTLKNPQPRERLPAVAIDLPAWLPADAWASWCHHRRGKRWTPEAAALSIRNLGKLREAGDEPRAVIEQSIANGWTGLFPLKNRSASAAPKRESNLAWMHGMLGTAPEPPPAFDLDLTAEEIRR
jgi:hypothetical protein